jgi:hypothetical protein
MSSHNVTTKQNFYRRVSINKKGCWLWTGYIDENGYGIVGYKRRNWKAHRLSWKFSRGDISGLKVLHVCDVRNCVNPDHLFLGTQLDNIRDCKNKGRLVSPKPKYGEDNFMSVLDESQVLEMRKLRKETGISYSKIAKKFNVSNMTAYRAIVGQSWNHIRRKK